MQKLVFSFCLILFTAFAVFGQNNVGINTTTPDASAALDITSSSQGVLVPRMNAVQKGNISAPATGLMIYQTDEKPGFYYNAGTPLAPDWRPVGGVPAGGTAGQVLTKTDATDFNAQWAPPTSSGGGGGVTLVLDATKSATQVGVASSAADVVFEDYDDPDVTIGSFDETTFTVTSPGLYLISVNLASNVTQAMFANLVTSVGTFYGAGTSNNQIPAPGSRTSVTAVVALKKDDTVKAQFSCNATTATLLGTNACRMTITKLN